MKTIKKRIRKILILVLIIFVVVYQNYNYNQISKPEITYNNALLNYNEQLEPNKIQALKEQYNNQDIKGIISITNENFSYPVVQTTNNEYYLNHNYNKEEYNLGSIYLDYRTNLNNNKILIYGHSSTKNKAPFNILENYYDYDYYKNHKYITLETETDFHKYEIFSVYVETTDFTYMNINFDNQEQWYSHILKLQQKSLYKTEVELTKTDNILILQTCSNNKTYQNYSKKYLLIVLRRVL